MPSPPPGHVRAAFGAAGEPVPLAGGQRPVWRCGGIVLKPLDTTAAAIAWQAGVLARVDALPDPGVRVAPPLPADDGAPSADGWTVGGWTAWRWEPGVPAAGDWATVITAGRTLHTALRDVARPTFLATRDDVWARADRLVSDARSTAPHPALAEAFAARRPFRLPDQLVHGDLTGNVHIDPAGVLPPLVLDLSPYWHPAPWASAVVVADALLFHDAAPDVVAHLTAVAAGGDPAALLLHAVLFRVVTGPLTGRHPTTDPVVGRTLDLTLSLLT